MVVARKIAKANPLWSTDTEATASALVFPAPAGRKVVESPQNGWQLIEFSATANSRVNKSGKPFAI